MMKVITEMDIKKEVRAVVEMCRLEREGKKFLRGQERGGR